MMRRPLSQAFVLVVACFALTSPRDCLAADENSGGATPPKSQVRPTPVLAYVLAGTGAAALGSFAYFLIQGRRQQREIAGRCAPHCSIDETDAMQTKFLAANLSLGIAALSFGGATYLYVSRPSLPADAVATRLFPVGDGLRIELKGKF